MLGSELPAVICYFDLKNSQKLLKELEGHVLILIMIKDPLECFTIKRINLFHLVRYSAVKSFFRAFGSD